MPTLSVQSLEERVVPAVNVLFSGGVLTLTGSAANEAVTVRAGATYTDVLVAGRFTSRVAGATSNSLSTINFTGGGGTDSLAVSGINLGLTVGLTDVGRLSLSSPDTIVTANTGVAFGVSTVTGTLNVNAAGAITQTGRMTIIGETSLTATGGNDITLGTSGNSFGTLVLNAANVTLNETGATDLGTISTGNLTVTASGAITDSGNLSITGNTSLTSSSSTVTLDQLASSFGGSTKTVALKGTNIAFRDTNATGTVLATSKATGTLDLVTAGDVTQTGGVTVTGLATITAGAGTKQILVNSATLTNNFGSLALTGTTVSITERSATDLAGVTASTLTVTSNSAITDSDVLTVSGVTSLTSTGGSITLDEITSTFGSTVTLKGRNIAIIDNDGATVLGSASKATGTLAVTTTGTTGVAANDKVTQDGAISSLGRMTITATGKDITLNTVGNKFGSIAVFGKDVDLREADASDLFTSVVSGTFALISGGGVTDSGDLTIVGTTNISTAATNKSITLDVATSDFTGALTLSAPKNIAITNTLATNLATVTATTGTLTVISGGDVSDSGVLTIGGRATITATGRDVTLDSANNYNSIAFEGRNVLLTESSATDIFTSTATGTFSLTSTGPITDSGTIEVVDNMTLSAAGQNITLDSAASTFGGNLLLTGAAVSVRDSDILGVSLGNSTVTGLLTITAVGDITDAAATAVSAGTATFNAGTGDITLTKTTLTAATKTLRLTGQEVSVTTTTAIDLGTSVIGGDFYLKTEGVVTQSGIVTVAGATTIDADPPGVLFDITLNMVGNSFGGTVVLIGEDVLLRTNTGISLGNVHTHGSLTIIANGNITNVLLPGPTYGVFDVDGAATFNAGTNSITLDILNSHSDFAFLPTYIAGSTNLVIPTASITLATSITPDDIVNIAESGSTITLTGTVGGHIVDGDIVTLTINGVNTTGAVASGAFSINVAGSDLAADVDRTINASVITTGYGVYNATGLDTETYQVDIVAPTITNVFVNDVLLSDADTGTNKLVVTTDFSESMNTAIAPTLTFGTSVTGSLTFNSGSWTDSDTYVANYNFADNNVALSSITIDVAGTQDAAFNPQQNYSELAEFSIDTLNPIVNSVTASPTAVVDATAGSGTFTVAVVFNEAMNTGATPTLTFAPTVASTLAFSSGAWTVGNTTYTATYNVSDENLDHNSVTIDVTNAQDAAGNAQQDYTPLNEFDIDTVNPTVTSVSVNDTLLSDADVGTDKLVVTIDFSETMNTGVAPTLTFGTSVTGTLTLNSGSWTDSDTYVANYNVADNNVTLTNVTIDVTGTQDANTNPQQNYAELSEFSVDTQNPIAVSFTRKTPATSPTNADTLVFLATFSEGVTGVVAADFAVTGTTATISVSQVTPSTYDVTISGGDLAALYGTVGLNLNTPTILDLNGNSLPNNEPATDETYVIDNTTLSVTVSGNDLVIEDFDGTGKDNVLSLSRSGANFVISDANEQFTSVVAGVVFSNGRKTITVPASALGVGGKIIFNTLGGSDSLSVDVSTDLGFDVDYLGGSGTSDSLTLVADNVTSVTYSMTNANDGSITIVDGGTRVITFTGLEPITDNLNAADRSFTFNGGGESISLVDAAGSAMTIDSDLAEFVTFANPTSSLTISAGTGNDTVTITSVDAAFDAALTINGGTGNDTIHLNSDITFAGGKNLNVDLQDDDATPGEDAINLGTNANLILSGTGAATLKASRNIALASGSSVVTANGNLIIEANQQATATSGNFIGVNVTGGLVQATGTGAVTVKGMGGNDGNTQYGVRVQSNGDIIGGTSGLLTVQGTGGASAGNSNYGVQVSGTGSTIQSLGANVSVTGTGGGILSSTNDYGVRVDTSGQIQATGLGTVTVVGNGGNLAHGVFILTSGSITSSGGSVSVTGTAGGTAGPGVRVTNLGLISAGGSGAVTILGQGKGVGVTAGVDIGDGMVTSSGGNVSITGIGETNTGVAIHIRDGATVTTATNGGTLTLIGDSLTVEPTATISAQSGSSVTILQRTNSTLIDLGGADVLTGSPLTLGLTDAELDRVTAGTVNIGDANSGTITFSADITRSANTNINLTAGSGNDIAFGAFSLNAGSGGDVTLTTSGSGAITTGDNTGTDLTADDVTLSAGSGGISSTTNFLRLAATTVTASTSGNGNINLAEADSVTIASSGLNAGTGTIALGGGTFTLGGSDRIADASDVNVTGGATLGLSTFTETIDQLILTDGSVTGSGTLTGTSTFDVRKGSISTILAGSVGMTKTTADVVTLSGSAANTFSGTTTVNAGTLELSKTAGVNAIGGSLAIGDGSGSDTVKLINAQQIRNDVDVSIATGGVLDLNGNNETFNGLTGTGTVNGSSGTPTLDLGGGGASFTWGGVIADAGGVVTVYKQGSTVVFTGSNTYSGFTYVAAGELALNNAGGNTLSDTGAVSITGSGQLRLLTSETIGSLTGSSPLILDGGSLTTGDANDTTFSGPIYGTQNLIKQGSGTFTISGSGDFSGTTTVNAGTLKLGSASALGTTAGGTTVTATGAVLDLNGQTIGAEAVTLNGTGISSAGALINSSGTAASLSGNITLASASSLGGSGNVTYSGTVNGGFGLTLVGAGTKLFSGIVGGTTAPTSLTQNDGTGAVQFNQDVTVGSGGAAFNGNVTLDGLTFTSGGAVTFGNAAGDSLTISGAATTVTTTSGDVTLNATTTGNENLTLNSAGGITINAPVTMATDKNFSATTTSTTAGISLATTDSDITATGLGTMTLTAARNIALASGSSVVTANGNLTVEANQQTTATSGIFGGIDVNGGLIRATGTGVVTVRGKGGDGASGLVGVTVQGGGDILGGTSGTLTVVGTGGAQDSIFSAGDYGLNVTGSGSTISSAGANVSVTGVGGSFGNLRQYGLVVDVSGQISAGGSGTVSVMGQGGVSHSNHWGVVVGSNGVITSNDGNVTVNGIGGGDGTGGSNNLGVVVDTSGLLSAGGSGTVSVTGQGGNSTGAGNFGVVVLGTVTSGGGAISVTGTATGTTFSAIDIGSTGVVTTVTNGGTISLVGDAMSFDPTAVISAQSGSSVTLRQKTNGVAIDLGGADASGTLGLTDAELDRVTAGTVNIGNANSATITVSAAITHANNLSLTTGAGIAVNQSITMAAGKSLSASAVGTISLGANLQTDGGSVTLTGNAALATSSVTIDTESGDDSNAGSVTFSGGSISSGAANRDLSINTTTGGTFTSGNISLSTVDSNAGNAVRNLTLNAARAGTPGTGASGDVTLVGAVTLESDGNLDIDAQTVTLSTSSSDVAVSGTGTASIDASRNVVLSSGSSLATVNGDLTVNANTVGTATGNVIGLDINGGEIKTTGSGNVSLTAKGGTQGVAVRSTGNVSATGGTVTIVGTGNNGTIDGNIGVSLGSSATVTSTTGALSITGTGGITAGQANDGIRIEGGASVNSTSGAIVTLSGTGRGSDGGNNLGVRITGTNSKVTSNVGNISVTGAGATVTHAGNYGVAVVDGGQINATGSAMVTVNATGGTGSDNNVGLLISGTNGGITSVNGDVALNGTAADSTGTGNHAISILSGGFVTTTGTANVTLTGTTTSSDPAVGHGISLGSSGTATLTLTGAQNTFVANSMDIGATATISAGTNTVTLRQQTNGTAIGLGAADSSTVLGLTDAELDRITAAGTLHIGNANSGAITVSAAVSRASGGGVLSLESSGAVMSSAGGTITVTGSDLAVRAGGAITLDQGNAVGSFAATTTSGGVTYVESNAGGAVNINDVDGVGGVSTAGGAINISTTDGSITVSNTTSANDVDADAGTVTLTAGQTAGTLRTLTMNNSSVVRGTGGVTFVANDMSIGTTGTSINGGTNTVTLRNEDAGVAIDLGTNTASQLGLTDTELDRVTAGTVQVGDTSSGTITVSAAITHANNLSLTSGAGITVNQAVTMASDKNFSATTTSTTAGISLATTNSDIAATGTGTISLTAARNIDVATDSSATTVNGTVTLSANQQVTPTSGEFVGVNVAGVVAATGTGTVSVSGRGGDSGLLQFGVRANNGRIGHDTEVAGAGTVTVTGQGGASGGAYSHYGVYVFGGNGRITSGGGAVSVTGTGGGAGTSDENLGVALQGGAKVTSAGTGAGATVTVVGNGGGAAGTGGSSDGVWVENSEITSSGGNVSVTGTGGVGAAGSRKSGVLFTGTGTITAGASGTVTVTATGGSGSGGIQRGIYMIQDGRITSSGGAITINATADETTGSFALDIQQDAQLVATTGTPTLTVNADSMRLLSTTTSINAGTNTVNLRPLTGGQAIAIDLGGADAANVLGLTDAELDRVTAGTINIGNANSGTITFTDDITRAASTNINLTAGSGNNIAFGTFSLNAGSSGDVSLTTSGTGAITTADNTGTDLTADDVTLNAGSGGIGSTTNFLRLAATTVVATTTGDGEINLVEADSVSIGANDLNAGTGIITLGGGTFLTTASGSILSPLTVANGATVGGIGSTADVTTQSGGSVSPGNSPGILNTANVVLVSGSTFSVEIGGTTAGNASNNYDQLNVTGTVDLGGATLSTAAFSGFVPVNGDTFVIVNNDSNDAIVGTFNGLAEGASISNFLGAGVNAFISYVGGSGNDAVITVDTVAPSLGITPNSGMIPAAPAKTMFTFQFSESVTGFDFSDISITGGSAVVGDFATTDSDTFTLLVTPNAGSGVTVTVSVGIGLYQDLAGNLNTALASASVTTM